MNRPQSLPLSPTRNRIQIGSPTKPAPVNGPDSRWRVVARPEIDQIEATRRVSGWLLNLYP